MAQYFTLVSKSEPQLNGDYKLPKSEESSVNYVRWVSKLDFGGLVST